MNMVIKPEHPSTQLWLLVANFTLHWWDKGPPSHGKRSLGRSTPVTSWDYGANFDKKASTMRDLYGFKGRMRLGLTGWLAHPIFRHTQISFLSFAISRRHQARLSCLRGASKGAPRPKLHKPAWGGARGDGFMARMMYIYIINCINITMEFEKARSWETSSNHLLPISMVKLTARSKILFLRGLPWGVDEKETSRTGGMAKGFFIFFLAER